MRPSVRLLLLGLLLAVLVTGGVVVVGTLTADEETEAPEEAAFATTALEDFDTSGLVVRRASFCSAVDPRQVEAALETPAESERSWDNGDRVEVSAGVRDVVHEYGCEYAAGSTTARAWVFAPPVDPSRAKQLARRSESGAGRCSGLFGGQFGEPSVMRFCRDPGTSTATVAGLIGDAWLTCELEVPTPVDDEALADRAGRWCVGVALAASSETTAAS